MAYLLAVIIKASFAAISASFFTRVFGHSDMSAEKTFADRLMKKMIKNSWIKLYINAIV